MKRRYVLFGLGALSLAQTPWASGATAAVVVFKNPSCGCCSEWVEHLRAAGFTVTTRDVPDAGAERKRLGMPESFAACHSASVGGYVVEGHVPAAEIQRLLVTAPAAVGLAVPGMPAGSPGMEAGGQFDPYDVLLVDRRGQATVFARYPNQRRGNR